MASVYYAAFHNIAVTNDADQDIWEIAAATGRPCRLWGWEFSSEESTAENANLRLVRRSASGNGAAVTEVRANDDGSAAASAIVEQLATIPGALVEALQAWKWEQLGPVGPGFYIPEARPRIGSSDFMCLNLNSALAATRQWSGWICWEEL